MTVEAAAIEYPLGATRQPLLFGGNASSGAVANEDVAFSDYLTLATPIPKGGIFRVWFYLTMPAGVLIRTVGADTATYGDVTSLGTSGSPAANTVLSGSAPGSNIDAGYVPVAAVIGQTVNKSVIVVGDSIAWAGVGAGGPDIPENINGRIGIICHGFPDDLPFLNLASSGALATNMLATSTGRQQLYPYCSHMVDESGVNDVSNNTEVATIIAAKSGIAAAFPSRVKKYCTTLGPTRASSTDGFTTVANQSIDAAHKATADGFNAAVRAGVAGFDGYFEIGDVLSTSRDSGKWPLTTYTTVRAVTDAAITAFTTTLTSATANFTADDIGTGVTIVGAGESGGDVGYWIQAVNSPTSVTLNGAAFGTVSGATAYIGALTIDGLHPTPQGYQLVADSGVIVLP
jgi:hypothetical protein